MQGGVQVRVSHARVWYGAVLSLGALLPEERNAGACAPNRSLYCHCLHARPAIG